MVSTIVIVCEPLPPWTYYYIVQKYVNLIQLKVERLIVDLFRDVMHTKGTTDTEQDN